MVLTWQRGSEIGRFPWIIWVLTAVTRGLITGMGAGERLEVEMEGAATDAGSFGGKETVSPGPSRSHTDLEHPDFKPVRPS